MTTHDTPLRLDTEDALAVHLDGLAQKDARLARAIARAGDISLRTAPRGFEGMARIICGQQLSVASARAIWGRVETLGATGANAYLGFDAPTLRATGLSRSKYETIRGVAEAVMAKDLDFSAIDDLPTEDAIAVLTKLKGVGPWTAEIYLLFCAGHPDIFPAGDLALQKAVAHAFELPDLPPAKALIDIASPWSPHRGAAALMFWRYFSVMKNSNAWDTL